MVQNCQPSMCHMSVFICEMELIKALAIPLLCLICDSEGARSLAHVKDFPFIGSLHSSSPYRFCAGILVDRTTAVIPAHCVLVNGQKNPVVAIVPTHHNPHYVMGVSNYGDTHNAFYQKRYVNKISIHPEIEFELDHSVAESRYDIAAVHWERAVMITKQVQTMHVIPEEMNRLKVFLNMAKMNVLCRNVGWGEPHHKDMSFYESIMLPIPPKLLTNPRSDDCCYPRFARRYEDCERELGEKSGYYCNDILSIAHSNHTVCMERDAGSPVYCVYEGVFYVVGMVVHCGKLPNHSYMVMDSVIADYLAFEARTQKKSPVSLMSLLTIAAISLFYRFYSYSEYSSE